MAKYSKALYFLPSIFTLSSVFCAFLAITYCLLSQNMGAEPDAYYPRMMSACLLVLLSVVFDTLDGRVARWTNTSTAFGMQLDSLADAISFGVAPAVILYTFSLQELGIFGLIAAFAFCCGAILRLARFNVEAPSEGVQKYFKGLPSPAGAAVPVATIMLFIEYNIDELFKNNVVGLAILSVATGLLMVSNVRYKTMKGKEKPTSDYIFVILGILLFTVVSIFESPIGGFFLLVVYFVLSGILITIGVGFKHAWSSKRTPIDSDSL
ncbi:MAG: CDP-diacylglycerol--serine O-phosphatidyltransferase [Bradymonadales bacterium]|jgi:CDP-diacylglycerol--serine O-phosphatidyltransferase